MADPERARARSRPGGVRWAIYGLVALLVSAAASAVAAMPSNQFDFASVPGAVSVPPPVPGASTSQVPLATAPTDPGAAPSATPPDPFQRPVGKDNQPKGYWPSQIGEPNRSSLYAVTLTTVQDPVAGVPGLPAPRPGTRLVATEFSLENGFDHDIEVTEIRATDMDGEPSGTLVEVDWGRTRFAGTVGAGLTLRGWALFEVSTDIPHFVATITAHEGNANTGFRFAV